MAVTQDDIDALTRAIASGERQVAIGGQQVTYRSIDDLVKARKLLMDELASTNGTPSYPRQVRLYHAGRGFD